MLRLVHWKANNCLYIIDIIYKCYQDSYPAQVHIFQSRGEQQEGQRWVKTISSQMLQAEEGE